MAGVWLVVLAAILAVSGGFIVLKDKEYIMLNDKSGSKSLNASTYNRLAFDARHSILYVTAKEPKRLTAYILDANDSPTLLTEVQFTSATEGQPLDIELCNPSGGGSPRLAISFLDPVSRSAEGVVRLYTPFTPLTTDLQLIKTVTVGAEPVDIKFAQDCGIMLVANRGRPTKEGSEYRDPEGTVSKILLPADLQPDSPLTTVTISFNAAFAGDFPTEDVMELREKNFRYYPLRNPQNGLLSIMQNIEPERLVVSPDGNIAFVSLPKNNAIARLTLDFDQVTRVFPLGNRSWTNYHMDPSDKDKEINLRGYNIYSLSQATEMAWITKGDDEWIVTLDTGKLNYQSAYGYADHDRARTLLGKGNIATPDSRLQAQLNNDTELGRLFISKEDGKSNSGKVQNVFTFGGRGFGIRDANNFETPTVVVDGVETETERYFANVFNTAYTKKGNTPQTDREATSPSLGPELTALAVGEYEGKTVLFMGGGSSGILYVYMLSPDARCLQPYFHSAHRAGDTVSTWQAAYTAGKMGDIGITDMMFIETSEIRPILVVASATSNSVSIYGIADEAFTPNSVRT